MITKLIAKAIVLNPAGQLLAMRRSADDEIRPGEWDLPGGGVEEGEHFGAATVREIQEEAGIDVEVEKLDLVYTATNVEEKTLIRMTYVCKPAKTDVRLSHEHSEHMWVTFDEAIAMFESPYYRAVFEHIQKHDILKDLPIFL